MTLLAFLLSDSQIARIDIAGAILMGVVMCQRALECDVTRAVQLNIGGFAALQEINDNITGATQRQVGINDIGLTDVDVARAYQQG